MKQSVIYKIINTINNKFYVGSTTNQYERFRVHRARLRNNKHHSHHLQAAWNKYGEQAFVFHVVEVVQEDRSLQEAEDVWLKDWVGKEECYNKSRYSGAPWRGGAKEDHPMYGKTVSKETKVLLRTARLLQADPRLGKTHSEETKRLIRDKKLANPTRAWSGKKRDEATRKKIGDAQRGVPKAPRTFTEEGLRNARENMKRNAREQKPSDLSDVLMKFPQETLRKYDFSNAVYTGALTRIENCVCQHHGVFSQYAAQFRKGRGCPECGAEQRAESRKVQMKQAWADPVWRENLMQARAAKKLLKTL